MAPSAPSPVRLRLATVLVGLALVATLAGCSGSDDAGETRASTAPASSTTDPLRSINPVGGPSTGICRPVLPEAERTAAYEKRLSVRCTSEHGAEVVASFDVPAAVARQMDADAIRADTDELQAILAGTATACQTPADEAVDAIEAIDLAGTPFSAARQDSALRGIWFLPSPDEWDAGERWLVCQVAAVDPVGRSIGFVGPLADLGRGRVLPSALTTCVDSGLRSTPCAPGTSRVVAVAQAAGDQPPAEAEATKGCRTLAERIGVRPTAARPVTIGISRTGPQSYEVRCLLAGPDPAPRT